MIALCRPQLRARADWMQGRSKKRGEIDRIQVSVFDIKILSHSVKSK